MFDLFEWIHLVYWGQKHITNHAVIWKVLLFNEGGNKQSIEFINKSNTNQHSFINQSKKLIELIEWLVDWRERKENNIISVIWRNEISSRAASKPTKQAKQINPIKLK